MTGYGRGPSSEECNRYSLTCHNTCLSNFAETKSIVDKMGKEIMRLKAENAKLKAAAASADEGRRA